MKINLTRIDYAKSAAHSLDHVALVPEVGQALKKWIASGGGGVLIGGLAMSFYAKPRNTEAVDLLFLTQAAIPESVAGFKRTRLGAFQENKEHVEIETVVPSAINITQALAEKVLTTARTVDGIKVASAEGLVALKLYASDNPRRKLRDLGDVERIVENVNVDLSSWPITDEHRLTLAKISNNFWS